MIDLVELSVYTNGIESTEHPTEAQILAAFELMEEGRRREGSRCTELVLIVKEEKDDPCFSIFGGDDGLYIVAFVDEQHQSFVLMDYDQSPLEEVIITTGGQETEHPRQWCCDRLVALSALKNFLMSGGMCELYRWTKV